MAWYGTVPQHRAMAWHGTTWHGTTWYITVHRSMGQHGTVDHGMAQRNTVWCYAAQHGAMWHGATWHGATWHSEIWCRQRGVAHLSWLVPSQTSSLSSTWAWSLSASSSGCPSCHQLILGGSPAPHTRHRSCTVFPSEEVTLEGFSRKDRAGGHTQGASAGVPQDPYHSLGPPLPPGKPLSSRTPTRTPPHPLGPPMLSGTPPRTPPPKTPNALWDPSCPPVPPHGTPHHTLGPSLPPRTPPAP